MGVAVMSRREDDDFGSWQQIIGAFALTEAIPTILVIVLT
jgi:hypothetical protein